MMHAIVFIGGAFTALGLLIAASAIVTHTEHRHDGRA